MRRTHRILTALILSLVLVSCAFADKMLPRAFIAREGKGYLERVGPQLVLHIKGSPEEMGYQYGVLLKDQIRGNLATLEAKSMDVAGSKSEALLAFDSVWRRQSAYVPERYVETMKGIAKGCGLPYDAIRRGNTIPEFFHCSGFSVFGKATKDGRLYHGRLLDYGVAMGLQEHAVVIIAEPTGYAGYVNVGYAGFLGSVTGMNLRGVSFGEMGGNGQGKWDGTPMAILMLRGLEEAGTLDHAKSIFRDNKRTCEYYYVISDCKIPSAVAVSATPEQIRFFGPNESMDPRYSPIQDGVVISGGDRYPLLVSRIKEKWGSLDSASCIQLMRRPVAMRSNLHCALMCPQTRELWVAHATPNGEPASEQPFTYLNVAELMKREPRH